MTVRELFAQVRDVLQDIDGTYFSESELLNIYNECKRYTSSERKENTTTITLALSSGVNEYTVDGVLRYISIKDSDNKVRDLYPDDGSGDEVSSAIIIKNYDTIYVNEPEDGVILNIKGIMFPEEDNLNDVIRSGDESVYKYYILSKCYEKDADMEQFQKAQYFLGMFNASFNSIKKNANLNYINKVNTTKGYFY